ncbi:MAG: hypothetical protein RJA76_287 [Bacteroidota bacterium]|jgi:cell division protein FtsI/penicillin-binding protein 2
MNGQQLFEQLYENLLIIGPSEKNLVFYNEIKMSIFNINIIDHFYQLKKNDKGEGLAFEIMFFDNNYIYDIVFTRTTVDYITVLINSVNMAFVETNYGQIKNEKGEITIIDKLQFSISYGGDLRTLVYVMEIKRFSEIHRIKNNLLNTIQK